MIFPGSLKSVAFSQVGDVSQDDAFGRKATLLRRKATISGAKATLFGAKGTVLGQFALNPVTGVNTPAAEAQGLGGKAGMGLNLPAAGGTMAP